LVNSGSNGLLKLHYCLNLNSIVTSSCRHYLSVVPSKNPAFVTCHSLIITDITLERRFTASDWCCGGGWAFV